MALVKLTVAIVATVSMVAAHAAIIDSTDHSYLTDTGSGLDWLDVTATQNLSYTFVSGQLGSNGLYQGWRYATAADFNFLVSNYTGNAIASNNYTMVYSAPDKIAGLIDLLGSTYNGTLAPELQYTMGYLADSSGSKQYTAWLYDYGETPGSVAPFTQARRDLYSATMPLYFGGNFLVRATQYVEPPAPPVSAVPAPPAFILMLTGLGVLGLTKRFRKEA